MGFKRIKNETYFIIARISYNRGRIYFFIIRMVMRKFILPVGIFILWIIFWLIVWYLLLCPCKVSAQIGCTKAELKELLNKDTCSYYTEYSNCITQIRYHEPVNGIVIYNFQGIFCTDVTIINDPAYYNHMLFHLYNPRNFTYNSQLKENGRVFTFQIK